MSASDVGGDIGIEMTDILMNRMKGSDKVENKKGGERERERVRER